MNKRRFVFMLVMLALIPVVAWAGVNLDGYGQLTPVDTPPTAQVSAQSGADAVTVDTPISNRRQITAGNTTVCVEPSLSGSSGDTVVVSFIPYHVDDTGAVITRMPGLQTATATAGTFTNAAGDNVAPALFFEVPSGCTHYEIRHAAPSAGNVTLTWIAYSADPQ
jgi:hypothetical protein